MIRKNFIITALLFTSMLPLMAQEKPLKREVTLYNPYKPSLNEAKKRSYLPEIQDTASFRPDFTYDVTATPFMPAFTVSPIKAATMQPDALDKLYRSYVKIGLGNNTSPLAEISITNERSKKGALGFYGRHYSNNGRMILERGQRVHAGYMDNDLSLFGKRFFRGGIIGGSVDYTQRSRHAYGFHPEIIDYLPGKRDIRLNYGNAGARFSISSTTLDSSSFSYDFDLRYNYFYSSPELYQHNSGLSGEMARSFKEFYVGSGLEFDFYNLPGMVIDHSKYIAALNPFIKKTTPVWNFKLGMQAVLERNLTESAKFHIYPDIKFGFSIVPSYINFFSSLSGRLEKNDPLKVIEENPFIIPIGTLYLLPNTDHEMVVKGGLKGNTGIEGNYEVSVSYSLISDMLFFANLISADSVLGRGNYFDYLADDVDLLTIHGGMTGRINEKLMFNTSVNLYRYTMTEFEFPWNKPKWDATFGLKYNLRDKILAGIELTALGERKAGVLTVSPFPEPVGVVDMPYHVNLNLSAEYRYSKILSFWAKFNNISHQKYFEWAYYPTQQFLFMLGFTYSL